MGLNELLDQDKPTAYLSLALPEPAHPKSVMRTQPQTQSSLECARHNRSGPPKLGLRQDCQREFALDSLWGGTPPTTLRFSLAGTRSIDIACTFAKLNSTPMALPGGFESRSAPLQGSFVSATQVSGLQMVVAGQCCSVKVVAAPTHI